MEQAVATFLRIYASDGNKYLWQNFYVDQNVNGYDFLNFRVSSLAMNQSADETVASIELPITPQHLDLLEAAVMQQWLCHMQVFRVNAQSDGLENLLTDYIGEVVEAATDLVQITISLGLALDALTAQIPGRRFTTALVGNIPRL